MPDTPMPPESWLDKLIERSRNVAVMEHNHLVPLADLCQAELAALRADAAKWRRMRRAFATNTSRRHSRKDRPMAPEPLVTYDEEDN